MNIKDYFKDIIDDMDTAQQRYDDAHPRYRNNPRKRTDYGLMTILAPQVVGFIVGLAFCRLFEFTGIAYIIFGVIGALLIGTVKNVEIDKISFKHALIRNLLISASVFVIGLIAVWLDNQ